MGACISQIREAIHVSTNAPDRDHSSYRMSRGIDKQIKQQQQADRSVIRLLLLGSGNSGKSTVMKQFKIIHKRGFTTEERRGYRDALWKSAVEAMRTLVRARQDYISSSRVDELLGFNDLSLAAYQQVESLGMPASIAAGAATAAAIEALGGVPPHHRRTNTDSLDATDQGSLPRPSLLGASPIINPSLEPYFQFLLYRVPDEQPLYDEIIIPVAAETSPRSVSPGPVMYGGSSSRLVDAASPLMTSGTVVLSSPGLVAANNRKLVISTGSSDAALSLTSGGSNVLPIATFPPSAITPRSAATKMRRKTSADEYTSNEYTDSVSAGGGGGGNENEGGSLATSITNMASTANTSGVLDAIGVDSESSSVYSSGVLDIFALGGGDCKPIYDESSSAGSSIHVLEMVPSVSCEAVSPGGAPGFVGIAAGTMVGVSTTGFASAAPPPLGTSFTTNTKEETRKQRRSESIAATTPSRRRKQSMLNGSEGSFMDDDLEDDQDEEDELVIGPDGRSHRKFRSKKIPMSDMDPEQLRLKLERKKLRKEKRRSERSTSSKPRSGTFSNLDYNSVYNLHATGSDANSMHSDRSRTAAGRAVPTTVTWEKMTVGGLLQKIWADRLIQAVFTMEEKNPTLEAPLAYIMNAIDRIAAPEYQPTNDDILAARKRTSGVNLLEFEAYNSKFLLIDVGGQKTERKKWLAHFDIVHAVIFVVGLDQYDQIMMEDNVTNRLKDSLALFEEMCSSPWFRQSSFLLFLNKADTFRTKIRQIPLTVCFRTYAGDPHDYDQCIKYITKRFQMIHAHQTQLYRDDMTKRGKDKDAASNLQNIPRVYSYVTQANDTDAMKFVIDTSRDILLRSEMARWGFFV